MLSEFKDFALKGNVLDLAVGVIIGGAFGGIVGSLIGDIIMPVVGMAGNVNFKDAYIPLSKSATDAASAFAAANPGKVLALADAQKAGSVLAYGNFITILINFIILAFCIFIVVKMFNTARKRFEAQKPAPAPAGPTAEQKLLTEIRDLLAKR
ncbi:MAG: large conductance mechanosensitive channel protein MscL [Phycisphaerales bacterium]|nr:large conductance mechanosensitive channel protein MscL [Phycisphaerales bacterium]